VTPTQHGVELAWPDARATFDAAVVATTPERARALLVTSSAAQRELLEHAETSCTAVCFFAVPNDIAGTFEGVWVPFPESHIVCAFSNESSKGERTGDRCLFSVFLHDETASQWLSRSDADILGDTAVELVRLFPAYAGHLDPLRVQRWADALPVYGVGQVSRVRRFWNAGQGDGGIWLCGDYLNHPWVEGAIRCGEKVAARIG
jgi:protoporphyrinogen oxidase